MEAGPEMDNLVSEYCVPVFEGRGIKYHPRGACKFTSCSMCITSCPHYSTDIAAAWQVVEAIVNRPKPLLPWGEGERFFELNHVARYGWFARIHENHRDWPSGPKEEPEIDVEVDRQATAPLAICRAALKAILTASSAPSRQ